MPKLIPELRERFLAAAQRRMQEDVESLTIRQIAADCETAAGTVYNYFPSKEALIAAVMQADWEACLLRTRQGAETAQTPLEGLENICAALRTFILHYTAFWTQSGEHSITRDRLQQYHARLVDQLEVPIREILVRFDRLYDDFAPAVLADLLLRAARSKEGFHHIVPTLNKLLA